MSASAGEKLFVVDVHAPHTTTEVSSSGLDVYFPDFVRGWSDVLDARIAPYTSQQLEEICHFAAHVHKKYVLVASSQLKKGGVSNG